MEYKIIATDMDGTLLTDGNELTKENIEAMIEAQKKGVKIVLASGRPTFAMLEAANDLKLEDFGGYILSSNGSRLINMKTKETVFKEILTKDDIQKIYEISKKLELSMILYFNDTVFGSQDTKNVRYEVDQCKMKFQKFDNINEVFEKNITETSKCMIIAEKEEIIEAEKYMKENYGKDYFIAISKPIFLEIANKNVDKGKTLKKLCEIENIKLEEVIAVGDSGNDKPLLEIVGMPVATENATESIKEISKFISKSNNEHALKNVVEKFFFSK